MPKLSVGNELLYDTIVATQRFTTPPARYNEASLVKRLEELGIGRPSTYAPTITTIINRGYVVKQSKEGQKRTCEQLTLSGGKVKPVDMGASTDWMAEMLRTAPITHNHNVAITGATKNFSYRGSVAFKDAQGIAKNSDRDEIIAALPILNFY